MADGNEMIETSDDLLVLGRYVGLLGHMWVCLNNWAASQTAVETEQTLDTFITSNHQTPRRPFLGGVRAS